MIGSGFCHEVKADDFDPDNDPDLDALAPLSILITHYPQAPGSSHCCIASREARQEPRHEAKAPGTVEIGIGIEIGIGLG